MLLAANFTPRDFHLILTYRPGDLPATRKEAVKRLRKFLAQLRAYRKARGLPLKYVYATEAVSYTHLDVYKRQDQELSDGTVL